MTMKSSKCVVCAKVKGKRICQLHGGASVCPRCCAQIRHAECAGCSYYVQAEAYAEQKAQAPPRQQHFIARIDPEVDEEVDEALTLLERGRRRAAEAILKRLLQQNPDLFSVHFAMGVAHAQRKRYDEALACFDKAIEIFPYYTDAWFNKAVAHQQKFEIEEMIRAFQKVVEFGDPLDEVVQEARQMLTQVERQLSQGDGIRLEAFLQASDLFNDAFAMMQEHRWQQALEKFQAVLALNPKHVQSHGNIGVCYGYLGRKREALAALDKALALDPDYGPALFNRRNVMALSEGERLPEGGFGSVDYYRDVERGRGR